MPDLVDKSTQTKEQGIVGDLLDEVESYLLKEAEGDL